MGFRDYDPGLNRFTTRDMYNGALADMSLGSDPFSGNRYAFTGGNPISNVEIDGHVIAALLPFLPAMVEGLAYAAAYVGAALLLTAATVDTVNAASGAWDDAEEGEETAPAPKPTPRSPADDGRSRAGCGGGWVKYGDLDAAHGNRATGVTACLTDDYLATHQGPKTDTPRIAPPGYRWAQDVATDMGLNAQRNINA